MAFFCPIRLHGGRKKKLPRPDVNFSSGFGLNHGMGRITGSASIETLVRVGIEKEHGLSPDSKMVVLHDFTPCVDDELEVKRGQMVNILYRENDWVYVIGQNIRQEGFIPYSYCTPYTPQVTDMTIKKKLPRDQSIVPVSNVVTSSNNINTSNNNTNNDHDKSTSENTASNPATNNTSNNNYVNNDNNLITDENNCNGNNYKNYNNNNYTNNIDNNNGSNNYYNYNNNNIIGDNLINSNSNNYYNNNTIANNVMNNNNNKNNDDDNASSNLAELIDSINDISAELLEENIISNLNMLQNPALNPNSEATHDVVPFPKHIWGRFIVLFTFEARDENDISVERGEIVTVLNRQDPEWSWIVRSDGEEGFVPSSFIHPADIVLQPIRNPAQSNADLSQQNQQLQQLQQTSQRMPKISSILAAIINSSLTNDLNDGIIIANNPNSNNEQTEQQRALTGLDDLRYHGAELIMLYNYNWLLGSGLIQGKRDNSDLF